MKVFTDGGCKNNGHPNIDKRLMKAVVTDDTGTMLIEKTLKGGSNNIAELWAVVEALMYARSRSITDLDIFTDSKNNLAWVAGRVGSGVSDRHAVMNLIHAVDNLRRHIRFTLSWLPREQNFAGIYIEETEALQAGAKG